MKRILTAVGAAMLGALIVTLGTAYAQGGTAGDGFPPPSALYGDAVLLARMIPIVIALAIAHGIWRGRLGLREPRSSPSSQTVVRHDWGVVTAHWANGIGVIVGMITGAIALRWLPRPDDMRLIFAIHYVGSALVIFGVASHLAQQAVSGGMGVVPRSLRDFRDGFAEIVEYTGIFGSSGAVFRLKLPKLLRETFSETARAFGIRPPKQLGKYLPAEKAFSYTPWAIIVTVIIVTGLVKALRYLYPIPPTFVATMSLLHDWFAAASIVMLAIHLSALLLVPRNWTLLASMFTTRVPRAFVQKMHPQWYKELVAAEQSTVPAPVTEVAPAAQAAESNA